VLVAPGPASFAAPAPDRRTTTVRVESRGAVLSGLVGLLDARSDLRPDGAWRAPAASLAERDAQAAAAERRALRATGAGEAVVIAACKIGRASCRERGGRAGGRR